MQRGELYMQFSTDSVTDVEFKQGRNDSLNLLLYSIALEGISLSRLIDAEAEKIRPVLNMGSEESSIQNILDINNSVQKTLNDMIKLEILIQTKLEDIIEIVRNLAAADKAVKNNSGTAETISTTTTITPAANTATGITNAADAIVLPTAEVPDTITIKTPTKTHIKATPTGEAAAAASTAATTLSTAPIALNADKEGCKCNLTGKGQGYILERRDPYYGGIAILQSCISSSFEDSWNGCLHYSIHKDNIMVILVSYPKYFDIKCEKSESSMTVMIKGVGEIAKKVRFKLDATRVVDFKLTIWSEYPDFLINSFRAEITARSKKGFSHNSGIVKVRIPL
jgi:hypothetical protein